MNCRVGERFAMKRLNNINSDLNSSGLDICKKIKDLTGKNGYYNLYHYISYPKKKIELNRKCPLCNSEWRLKEQLFDTFDFKCDKCLIISNISRSLNYYE